jgi:hypothetical protein
MNKDKYINLLEREIQLWKARVVFEQARHTVATSRYDDYDLPAWQLRDLPFTKQIGLDDLCWSMTQQGNNTKADWELLRDEWWNEWTKAYKEIEEEKYDNL